MGKKNRNPLESFHIDVKAKSENQKKFLKEIKDKQIVIGIGPAGTGKTFLTVAEALRLLKNPENKFHKIILIKSVTTLKDEEIGFLKGSLDEKMMPFMYSFMSNFYKLIGKFEAELLRNEGFIEVLPLAFVRGMSIDHSIIIVDEAQNISVDNMLSIMTRIGENSKMVVIGDTQQIDIKNKKISSLEKISTKFESNEHFGIIKFEHTDQVRNPIINVIEDKFNEIKDEMSKK